MKRAKYFAYIDNDQDEVDIEADSFNELLRKLSQEYKRDVMQVRYHLGESRVRYIKTEDQFQAASEGVVLEPVFKDTKCVAVNCDI